MGKEEVGNLIETIEKHCRVGRILFITCQYDLVPTIIEDICELSQQLADYAIEEICPKDKDSE